MEKKKTSNSKTKNETKTIELNVDTLKNVAIVVLIVIIIFGGSFLASNNSKDYKKADKNSSTEESSGNDQTSALQKESESISEDEQADIEEVSVDKYLELMDEDEPSVIYIARPTCSYCQIETPIMKHVVYQYPDARIYYLNTDEFEDEDQSKFIKSDDMFSESFGTPTTIVVKGGKVVDSIAGATTGDNLIELFKKNGIIE